MEDMKADGVVGLDPPGCIYNSGNNKYYWNDYTKSTTQCSNSINVYANQKHVSTVLPVHIKTKQVLLRVKPVRLGRTIPNKDKLVAKHVNLDIHVKMQTRTSKYVLPVHIKTKQVLLRVKPVHLGRTIPNKDKLLNLVAKHVKVGIFLSTGYMEQTYKDKCPSSTYQDETGLYNVKPIDKNGVQYEQGQI